MRRHELGLTRKYHIAHLLLLSICDLFFAVLILALVAASLFIGIVALLNRYLLFLHISYVIHDRMRAATYA